MPTARSVPWARLRLVRRRNWRSGRRPALGARSGSPPPASSAPASSSGLPSTRHPVAGRDAEVAARADDELAAGRRRPRPGRGRRTARAASRRRRPRPRRRRSARSPSTTSWALRYMQASITAGAKRPATSSAEPCAGRLFDRAADGRVVEVGDDGDVVAQVAGQQRRLDVPQVAAAGADDRPRPGDPGRAAARPRGRRRRRCGRSPSLRPAACGAAGSSSTTATATPVARSCSTVRSPTPSRPQTITWPLQSRACCGDGVWCPRSAQAIRAARTANEPSRLGARSALARRLTDGRSPDPRREKQQHRPKKWSAAVVQPLPPHADPHLRRHRRPGAAQAAAGDAAPLPVGADAGIPGASASRSRRSATRSSARSPTTPAREFGRHDFSEEDWDEFSRRLVYVPVADGPREAEGGGRPHEVELLGADTRLLHYLSVPPAAAADVDPHARRRRADRARAGDHGEAVRHRPGQRPGS